MKRFIKYIAETMPSNAEIEARNKAKLVAEQKEREILSRPSPLPDKCKKEKDHIIGIYYDYDDTDIVRAGDTHVCFDHSFHPFHFCPACGKNITRLVNKLVGTKCSQK